MLGGVEKDIADLGEPPERRGSTPPGGDSTSEGNLRRQAGDQYFETRPPLGGVSTLLKSREPTGGVSNTFYDPAADRRGGINTS